MRLETESFCLFNDSIEGDGIVQANVSKRTFRGQQFTEANDFPPLRGCVASPSMVESVTTNGLGYDSSSVEPPVLSLPTGDG
jgi:hypothetical protein